MYKWEKDPLVLVFFEKRSSRYDRRNATDIVLRVNISNAGHEVIIALIIRARDTCVCVRLIVKCVQLIKLWRRVCLYICVYNRGISLFLPLFLSRFLSSHPSRIIMKSAPRVPRYSISVSRGIFERMSREF